MNKYLQFQVEYKLQEIIFLKLCPKMNVRKCNILCSEHTICRTVPDGICLVAHKKNSLPKGRNSET